LRFDSIGSLYGEIILARNLHFIIGKIAKRQGPFFVIEMLRSGLDPEELGKRGKLF
jgi:hypothetical protein